MELKKLTDRIYYLPHEEAVDRPALAYLRGDRFTMAVDAGYSERHVDDFYNCLEKEGLLLPDFTVITHWHYDHTFGMCHIHGASIAHEKTNRYLKAQQEKALDPAYMDFLKGEDPFFGREYKGIEKLQIVLPDLQFQTELLLDLGGVSARIYHCEAPHSEDTVCIYIPEEKILFLGDSTSEDFFNDGYMDKGKLRKLVDGIEETVCEYCVLSHAEPLRKEELLRYLNGLLLEA